ncbi:helicase C-terminal domain-containing protein [Streptomyces sp. UNOC14_S4]|uniref:helicase C-terminal domain-containing protein n=1 Tax=Streptomyces sp. UNOC14_S4 TaxID=2872340 RepID=UPI001E2FA313|nr:helicase C-terminal domain-containing protein [Streptomyces sp. UNOC14_S4]
MASWLHNLDTARLEQVLAARADAVSAPEPRSAGELADRLQRPGSVVLVLPRLALPHLQVIEALAALGPVPRDALAELLGAEDGELGPELDAALETLAGHALVWPDGEGLLHMAAPLLHAWDTPLGLDAPLTELLGHATSDELLGMLRTLGLKAGGTKQQRLAALIEHHSDPGQVVGVVAQAPAATRELLDRRARAAPERPESVALGSPGNGPEPGARWALERGLLVQDRHRHGPARMPAEVALVLRGADWYAPFDPAPPVTASVAVTPADVEGEAAAAAMAFATHGTAVLAVSAASPPARLKAGGIGARELSRIGKAARCDETVVRVVLETAYAAGLLARDGDEVAATETYDAWAGREPAEQVAVLLQAWRTLPFTPAQARDEEGKPLPALSGTPRTPPRDGCLHARDAREGLLAAAARLPAGRGVKSGAELGPSIAWCRPLAEQLPQDAVPFATVIREAELLGVLARGALSPIGTALLDDDAEALAAACRRLLPAATVVARFGADLTAVVTGTPSARLVALLDSVADREASGTASVWRFGPAAVRRALDTGRGPGSIVEDLAAVAVEPLPQPLSYLIHDTARGHGRVRVAAAACVIHSEEPVLMDELAAHRKLAELGLRRLAPTVLVSRSPLERTLAALRATGYAPIAERADGTVRIERAAQHRATAPASVPPPRSPVRRIPTFRTTAGRTAKARTTETPTAVDLGALAARLRAAPPIAPQPDPDNGVPFDSDTEEIIAAYAHGLPLTDVRQLAHAVNEGRALTIEYVAASGNCTVRTVSKLELDAPHLYAWCHLRNDERVFTISRIHGVMPA